MNYKTYSVKNLGELHSLLGNIINQYGGDVTWNGWDDGSLNIYTKDNVITIERTDDGQPSQPPPVFRVYRCPHCGGTRTSSEGPVSCRKCSWSPMMKLVEEV